jgi:hypothetical protein
MNKKKLYFVKREVLASNIKEAVKARGIVYSVEFADERLQPAYIAQLGFDKKKAK